MNAEGTLPAGPAVPLSRVPTPALAYEPRGFTLLEAILTVGILLILASISIPAYNDYIGDFRQINARFSSQAATATAQADQALSSAQ